MTDRSGALSRAPGASYVLPGDPAEGYLRVTAAHIEQGEPGNPESCPVILALKEQFDLDAHLGGEHPYIKLKNGGREPLKLGPDIADWVGRYDRHELVEPQEWLCAFSQEAYL
jgi:hypothetical protein